jgi:hypothetical protein
MLLPFLPIARTFGFVPMSKTLIVCIIGITAAYVASTELLNRRFFKRARA